MKINQRSFGSNCRLKNRNQRGMKMQDCVLLHSVCCTSYSSWNSNLFDWNNTLTCLSNTFPAIRVGELYFQLFKGVWINL